MASLARFRGVPTVVTPMLQHWLLRCPPPYPLCLTPPNKYPKLRSIIPPPSCFPIFHSTGRTGPRSHKSHSHFLALSPLSPSKDRQTGGRLAFVPYLPAYSLLLPLRPLPARGRSLSSRLSPTPTRQGPPLLPLLFSPFLPVRGHSCSLLSPPVLCRSAALPLCRSLPFSPYRPHSYPSGATLAPPVSLLAYTLTPATIRLISAPLPPSPLEDRQEAGSLPCLATALTPFSAPPPTRQGPLSPPPVFPPHPYPSGATLAPLASLPLSPATTPLEWLTLALGRTQRPASGSPR